MNSDLFAPSRWKPTLYCASLPCWKTTDPWPQSSVPGLALTTKQSASSVKLGWRRWAVPVAGSTWQRMNRPHARYASLQRFWHAFTTAVDGTWGFARRVAVLRERQPWNHARASCFGLIHILVR